jgi:hypothetical protein
MAKQLMFDDIARTQLKDGLSQLAKAVKVTLGPLSKGNKGRRLGQQGNRAARTIQEHGRKDGQRGRQQNLRRCR